MWGIIDIVLNFQHILQLVNTLRSLGGLIGSAVAISFDSPIELLLYEAKWEKCRGCGSSSSIMPRQVDESFDAIQWFGDGRVWFSPSTVTIERSWLSLHVLYSKLWMWIECKRIGPLGIIYEFIIYSIEMFWMSGISTSILEEIRIIINRLQYSWTLFYYSDKYFQSVGTTLLCCGWRSVLWLPIDNKIACQWNSKLCWCFFHKIILGPLII